MVLTGGAAGSSRRRDRHGPRVKGPHFGLLAGEPESRCDRSDLRSAVEGGPALLVARGPARLPVVRPLWPSSPREASRTWWEDSTSFITSSRSPRRSSPRASWAFRCSCWAVSREQLHRSKRAGSPTFLGERRREEGKRIPTYRLGFSWRSAGGRTAIAPAREADIQNFTQQFVCISTPIASRESADGTPRLRGCRKGWSRQELRWTSAYAWTSIFCIATAKQDLQCASLHRHV